FGENKASTYSWQLMPTSCPRKCGRLHVLEDVISLCITKRRARRVLRHVRTTKAFRKFGRLVIGNSCIDRDCRPLVSGNLSLPFLWCAGNCHNIKFLRLVARDQPKALEPL